MNEEKIRRVLRDFWNENYHEIDEEGFIPHIGDDLNCKFCQIEKKYIKKIENLKTSPNNNFIAHSDSPKVCPRHTFARQLTESGYCQDCGGYPLKETS